MYGVVRDNKKKKKKGQDRDDSVHDDIRYVGEGRCFLVSNTTYSSTRTSLFRLVHYYVWRQIYK